MSYSSPGTEYTVNQTSGKNNNTINKPHKSTTKTHNIKQYMYLDSNMRRNLNNLHNVI